METLLLWGLGLFALAGLLFFIEMFVPSGGILGMCSIVVAIAGVIAFWRHSAIWGGTSLLVVLVMIPICFNFALRVMPHTPIGRMLILSGDDAADDQGFKPDAARSTDNTSLIGEEGVVLTELRPVGEVRVKGERYEGHAEQGIISAGSRVRVIDIEGGRLTVRAV